MDSPGTISLTIISENQNQIEEAEVLARKLIDILGNDWKVKRIEKYLKFANSFKIELDLTVKEEIENRNMLAIALTDKIASPWLVYFDEDENRIELIYNKSENSRVRINEFNQIIWGHLVIIN